MNENNGNKPPRINWLLITILCGILMGGFTIGFNLKSALEQKADKTDVERVNIRIDGQDKAIQALLITSAQLVQNVDRLANLSEKDK